jgi:hypothetical protein
MVAIMLGLTSGLALASCTKPCTESRGPDATADFSSLRLTGKLRCNASSNCEMTFTAAEGVLVVQDAGIVNQLTYDIVYGPTRTQTQNVTSAINFGGNGACLTSESYRRETWTVPTVTMTLRSGTRNGQPLPIDETTQVGRKPSAFFPRLEVKTQYVDRKKNDEYVGVLVTGQPVTVADSPEMAITKTGSPFTIGPNND